MMSESPAAGSTPPPMTYVVDGQVTETLAELLAATFVRGDVR